MKTSEKFSKYVLPTYGRFGITPSHAKGTEFWDTEGKRYLDFCTGIAVCSLGHSHPAIVDTVKKQSEKLMHCSNLYLIEEQADLAEIIVEECVKYPGKVFFSNSGAEANDGLIKTARRYGHTKPKENGEPRIEIISFKNSFHGRTMGSMFATGQDVIHDRFTPIPEGYKHLPLNDIKALKDGITEDSVAILIEPIQGEGGVNPATPEFLREINNLCKQHDLLLFFDEVQVGFGRCGDLMAWKRIAPEIQPDGIAWAKGMGGGIPIGSFFLSDRAIDNSNTTLSSLMGPKSHGSTYGGNPLSCAVAITTLRTIIDRNLSGKALQDEQYIRDLFKKWSHPAIDQLTGMGLLLGIKINAKELKVPEGSTAALAICIKLNELGLLTVPAGADTLRWLPPLNVQRNEIDEAFFMFKEAIKALT